MRKYFLFTLFVTLVTFINIAYCGWLGDSLGDHKAKRDLNMRTYKIFVPTITVPDGNSQIWVSSPISISGNLTLTNGTTLQINSSGEDKNFSIYHNDTNAYLCNSSGNLFLETASGKVYIYQFGYNGKLTIYNSDTSSEISIEQDETNGIISTDANGDLVLNPRASKLYRSTFTITGLHLYGGLVTPSDIKLDSLGTNVNSPNLSFRADDGGVEEEATIHLAQGADPYLRISVDDDNDSPVLTGVIDIHDTVIAFVNDNSCDIGASEANRPKDYYGSGNMRIGGDMSIDGNNLDLGIINIDYDAANWEVDIDTKVHCNYLVSDTTVYAETGNFHELTAHSTLQVNSPVDFNRTSTFRAPLNCESEINGCNISVSGDITQYGGIITSSNTNSITLTTQDIYYQVNQFTSTSPFRGTVPSTGDDEIKISTPGVYFIYVPISFSASAKDLSIEFILKKNDGATELPTPPARQLTNGVNTYQSISFGGLATLSLNDTVEIWVRNRTGDGATVNIFHASLSLFKL